MKTKINNNVGRHNADIAGAVERLNRHQSYENLSTVIICPTRGQIDYRVVGCWSGLMRPMNQKVIGPLFCAGKEVGQAYHELIEMILNNPELKKWKYVLTIEEDNLPPPDGLLKLYESINGKVDGVKYDAVGGLYWTKGDMGMPMVYGHPDEHPRNFIPQLPIPETVQRCNGLGMGFTLFRMSCFNESKIGKPWFRTVQDFTPGVGTRGFTQDLDFFNRACAAGMKFASDNRVRVGHLDAESGITW